MKDTRDIDFPILGVCQGFELLGLVISGDRNDFLKDVKSQYEQRTVEWQWESGKIVQSETKTFRGFDVGLLERMGKGQLVVHFH